jgi:hypothetical protein
LGNKADLLVDGTPSCVPPEELAHFISTHGFYAHAECSAATGAQVKESCINLVARIHQNNQTEMTTPIEKNAAGQQVDNAPTSQPVKLAQPAQEEKKGGCCS